MNSYISPSNQKLLWNTIQRSPLFQKKTQKDVWFKNIIGQFYENNRYNQKVALIDINASTINYMMKLLKEEDAKQTESIVFPSQSPTAGAFLSAGGAAAIPMNASAAAGGGRAPLYAAAAAVPYTKEELANMKRNAFDAKLQEMEQDHRSLLAREIPPEIDFRDKITDDADAPISNMGDLIKAEIEKRNREIQDFTPAAAAQPPPLPPPPAKRVSWKDDMEATAAAAATADMFQKIMDNMTEQREKIAHLTELVGILQTKIVDLLERPTVAAAVDEAPPPAESIEEPHPPVKGRRKKRVALVAAPEIIDVC